MFEKKVGGVGKVKKKSKSLFKQIVQSQARFERFITFFLLSHSSIVKRQLGVCGASASNYSILLLFSFGDRMLD